MGRSKVTTVAADGFDPTGDLSTIIAGGIRPVYQPIVEIDGAATVGFEALARGPHGSALESPLALFGAARTGAMLAELDRACLLAACEGADATGLSAPAALFVNVEPEVIDSHLASTGLSALSALSQRLDIFLEVTERALARRPAQLLESVERLRGAGVGIALDDVGANPRSLALLPLLRPDVVKLDMSLIQQHPSRHAGVVLNGVCAYAEASGAVIVAEGVETEAHLIAARSMGASLAQGWLFGHPGPLPAQPAHGNPTVTLGLAARSLPSTPAELVHQRRTPKIGTKEVLLSVTQALEAQALDLAEYAILVTAFQDAEFFTPQTRRRYEELAERTSLTVALGEGFSATPAEGVHGASLAPDDPLREEWDIAVLGPHYAGALVARDLGDDGPDRQRRFEFVLTFDRELVVDVAAALISRLTAADPSAHGVAGGP